MIDAPVSIGLVSADTDNGGPHLRKPDLIVGPSAAPTYYRWQLFKVFGFQLCLHKWLRSDDDRALHDHSGDSISFILNGGYLEVGQEFGTWLSSEPAMHKIMRFRKPWTFIFRKAETPHRVVLGSQVPVWSLWFRWPPRREWGFHCPRGWRHWKDYLDSRGDYYAKGSSETGPGCD